MTSMALNVWLNTSHPTMPNLVISGPALEGRPATPISTCLRAAAKAARAMD
jgi:hypothetical protein